MLTSFRLLLFAPFLAALPAQVELAVEGLPPAAPLTVTATATPERLIAVLSLDPEWHVYSRDVGGGRPVALRLADGCAFDAAGAPSMPAGQDGKVRGEVEVTLPLRATAAGGELVAVLEFMACDPLMCLPPMAVTLRGTVAARPPALRVLLVVDERDERAARIESFLRERGVQGATTTYGEVTAADCEAHDVVLADSKRFGETMKGARAQALAFPKTTTPTVAVGFLGTELVEAHEIAMTSGYV